MRFDVFSFHFLRCVCEWEDLNNSHFRIKKKLLKMKRKKKKKWNLPKQRWKKTDYPKNRPMRTQRRKRSQLAQRNKSTETWKKRQKRKHPPRKSRKRPNRKRKKRKRRNGRLGESIKSCLLCSGATKAIVSAGRFHSRKRINPSRLRRATARKMEK